MLLRILNKAEEAFIALLLVAMTLMVFADVVMRFVFNTGLIWSQELTLYLSAWFVLFGISYGLKVGAHIGVDAFVKLLPGPLQRLATIIAILLCLAYCAIFIYGAWIYLAKMYLIGLGMEDLKVPMWLVGLLSEESLEVLKIDAEDPALPLWFSQGMMIVGLLLFSLRLLQMLWGVITGREVGFRHVDEAEESMHLAEELAAEKESDK